MKPEYRYRTSTRITPGASEWTIAGDQQIRVGIPREFDGSDDALSPEHLYAASILSCYLAAFQIIAKRSSFSYGSASASATLTATRQEDRSYLLDHLRIDLSLAGASDRDLAQTIAAKAEENCYVSRSIKTKVEISCTFSD